MLFVRGFEHIHLTRGNSWSTLQQLQPGRPLNPASCDRERTFRRNHINFAKYFAGSFSNFGMQLLQQNFSPETGQVSSG